MQSLITKIFKPSQTVAQVLIEFILFSIPSFSIVWKDKSEEMSF